MRCVLCQLAWLALLGGSFTANAQHTNCDRAPYGDSPEYYNKMMAAVYEANAQGGLTPELLPSMYRTTLETACKAKYQHGDRALFYREGFTDRDIDALSTGALTDAWFAARNQALAKEQAPQSTDDDATGRYLFALFYCFQNQCTMYGEPRMGAAGERYYVPSNSLAACHRQGSIFTDGKTFGPDGRISLPDGGYWECRKKPADEWEPAR